jgi:outer membrane protein
MTRPISLLLLLLAAGAARAEAPPGVEGPLTLDQAVALAVANQPQLRSAQAQVRAAQARGAQSLGAALPQVSGTAGYTRSNTTHGFALVPSTTAPSGFATERTTSGGDRWSAHLDASQTLFDPATWYRASADRSTAAAQAETARATLQGVVLSVRTAWFQAAAARDLVAVARETLANREGHLKQVQGFVEVGTRPEIDLAQARADRANAVVQLIGAENGLATAHAGLNQAMGVLAGTDYPLADDPFPAVLGEEAAIDALVAEALAGRPDVVAKVRQREAQQATWRAASSGYLPTIGASGQLARTGSQIDDLAESWNVGLTLTWPLFQGGQTRGRVAEAQAQLDALDADAETLRQEVRLQLEQARLSVRSARATVEASREVVVNSRERLRLAQARYQAGLGSAIELSDAQVAVTNAAAQEVQSRFTLASARAQLAFALGRG